MHRTFVFSVGSGHPRPGSVPLHPDHRRGFGSHSSSQCSLAGRCQSFRLDARALAVSQEGSDTWFLQQGNFAQRRGARVDWTAVGDRSAALAA